jgi:hypothetical protein
MSLGRGSEADGSNHDGSVDGTQRRARAGLTSEREQAAGSHLAAVSPRSRQVRNYRRYCGPNLVLDGG